jgi:hypothetical protein
MTHTRCASRNFAGAVLLALLPLASACGTSTPTGSTTATLSTATSATTPSAVASTSTATTTAAATNQAYCDALRTGQTELGKISGGVTDPAAAKQGMAALEKMQAAAPDEVASAWADLITMMKAVTSGDMNAAAAAADKAQQGMTAIEQHAKAECGITLS